eukprot:5699544-Pleurochrysis_carterae.AAC.1
MTQAQGRTSHRPFIPSPLLLRPVLHARAVVSFEHDRSAAEQSTALGAATSVLSSTVRAVACDCSAGWWRLLCWQKHAEATMLTLEG